MANEYDARQIVSDLFVMSLTPVNSQSTITRHEQIRIRMAVITGVLDSTATTSVFLKGVTNPVMLAYQAIIESSTDNWTGYDFRGGAAAGSDYEFLWRGPLAATNPNSFFFSIIGGSVQSKNYRIWCVWAERI